MFKLFKKKKSNLEIKDTGDIAVFMMSNCVNSIRRICDCRPEHIEYPDCATVELEYDGMKFKLDITLNPITPEETA